MRQSRDQMIKTKLIRRLVLLQSLWKEVLEVESAWRVVFLERSRKQMLKSKVEIGRVLEIVTP